MSDPTTLQMYLSTIKALCLEELGRLPDVNDPNDLGAAIMLQMALGGRTGPELREWLRAQPEAVAFRTRTAKPPPVALPALVPDGHVFRLATGGRFSVRECSDFALLARYIKEGEAVARNVMEDRQFYGFDMLRVWTRFGGDEVPTANRATFEAEIGRLQPSEHPVYDAIPDFLQAAADHGLYVELTAYCGGSRDDHWERLGEAVTKFQAGVSGQTLAELINEYDAYSHQIRVQDFSPIRGVLCCHGSAGSERLPPRPAWDYEVLHVNEAGPEWPRKGGHNALELSVGDPEGKIEPSHVPAYMNESPRPDRDGSLAHHEDAAACAALLCAGSVFHSRSGKRSIVFDDFDRPYAQAFIRGALSVDLSYQHEPYRHGDEEKAREKQYEYLRCYRRGDSPFVDVRR